MPEPLRTTTQNPAFPALPPHLERATASLPIAELLGEIVERYGGDIAHTRVLGQVTHDFIIGRVKAKTLVTELVTRFGISEEDARTIARELYETVFEPLGERLKALPPPKPIVLQPLPPQARPIEGTRDQALGTGVAETRRVPLPPPATPPPPAQISAGETWAERPPAPSAPPRPAIPPSPPPWPTVPPVWPAPSFAKASEGKPPVPSKPVLRPTPPPPAFVKTSAGKPVTEAEADLTLERMLAELPPELRSAVRPIPLERVIYTLGREHQLTIEEIGRLAEGVLEFIAGKTHWEDLLATLTRLVKGDRAKAAAASDELNAKVFGPIRAAMKQATAPPPPPPPKPPASPAPPTAKKLEPLIIYPLSMARPPAAGITNLESGIMARETPAPPVAGSMKQEAPNQSRFQRDGTGQARSIGQETPGAAPPVVSPSTPLGASRAEPPVVSHVEPPPTLPVYEEARDKGEPPKPSPDEHLRQDPYREPME